MTYPDKLPAWRAAWQLDDPDWVSARKKAWKDIKNSIPVTQWLTRREQVQKLKNFFMTGSAFDPELAPKDWAWHSYHPDKGPLPLGEADMLMEAWLTADQSEQNWRHIQEKYTSGQRWSARSRFREVLNAIYPEHGSVFGGLEGRLYRLLGPTRCRPEDYPDKSPEVYQKICASVYAQLVSAIRAHLMAEQADPDNIAPELAREWCDSVPGAYQEKVRVSEELNNRDFRDVFVDGLTKLLLRSLEITKQPDSYHPTQVALARDIIQYLSEMDLPKPLQDRLSPYFEDPA